MVRSEHPVNIAVYDLLRLFRSQDGGIFGSKPVPLAFLLQVDHRRIAVIEPDSEFFPHIDTVDLFPQGFVIGIIKVQASYIILSIDRVRIALHDGPKPLAQGQQIPGIQNMFPFMSVFRIHKNYLLYSCWAHCKGGRLKKD